MGVDEIDLVLYDIIFMMYVMFTRNIGVGTILYVGGTNQST